MNLKLFQNALYYRLDHYMPDGKSAMRLFNGFLEGEGNLVVDLYGSTLVFFVYDKDRSRSAAVYDPIVEFYLNQLPIVNTVLLKDRFSEQQDQRNGVLLHGTKTDQEIREFGVRYAVDLLLNQDAGFYLDTRNLRKWLLDNMGGKSVLNTFAYTGSLGVAAKAGGASAVVQTDLNKRFLNMAKTSYTLNGFPIQNADFLVGDFFKKVAGFKREGRTFDCIILDPPFFAATRSGRVDLVKENQRLINKVRPLVNHDGYLVVINNALFVSGQEYLSMLDALLGDYLSLEKIIPIPNDTTGSENTRQRSLPADPAPFNHATKIVILKTKRKQTS